MRNPALAPALVGHRHLVQIVLCGHAAFCQFTIKALFQHTHALKQMVYFLGKPGITFGARLKHIQTMTNIGKFLAHRTQLILDTVKPGINSIKTPINGFETPVDSLKALVDSLKASVDGLKARIHLLIHGLKLIHDEGRKLLHIERLFLCCGLNRHMRQYSISTHTDPASHSG